jgi:hypothetical protein
VWQRNEAFNVVDIMLITRLEFAAPKE